MEDKNLIMYEYLKSYEPLQGILQFNALAQETSKVSLNTVSSDDVLKSYTSGDKLMQYDFAIQMLKQHDSDGISTINIEQMYDAQLFMNWIKEQNKNKNFPTFPGVLKIENLQDEPDLAGVQEGNLAKYMFQCRVIYYMEKEE